MLIDIRMPAFISSAILPRQRSPRRVMALVPTVVELQETDEACMRLVARGTYRGYEPEDVRAANGLFYRKLKTYDDKLEPALIGHFWHETFVKQARRALPRLGDVLPRGAAWNIINRDSTRKTVPSLVRIGKSMELNEEGERELAEVRSDYVSVVSKAMMMGGDCWVPTPEPMLSVAHWTDNPMTMHIDSHFSGPQMRRLFNDCFLGRTFYTIKQLPEALAADMASPGERDGVSMEVFDSSVFSDEVPVGEAIALLWYIGIRKEIAKPIQRRLLGFVRDEQRWTWDAVSSEIEYVLSRISLDDKDRRMLEFHMARIDDRPIAVEPHLRPMAAGR
ncbi:hypothetical protein [Rhizobium sp. BK176]|uniref:hypothetical protein n=1 Tax=Rhizobium sp. BK176 TaxID=2587071 RepID=UPI00216A42A2|nr:hypothetical protein [Rhizobium sp. BK176]MCS4089368.1 hypothetical protein [Rhizobium sp. BK176]